METVSRSPPGPVVSRSRNTVVRAALVKPLDMTHVALESVKVRLYVWICVYSTGC